MAFSYPCKRVIIKETIMAFSYFVVKAPAIVRKDISRKQYER